VETAPQINVETRLRRLDGLVRAAARSRALLVDQLARVQREEPDSLARAGRIAGQCAEGLDETRRKLQSLQHVPGLELSTDSLDEWINCLVTACDAVQVAAGTRDPAHLDTAAGALRDAEPHARQFNLARRMLARRLVAE
jgi:hypothetical protein